MTRLVVESEDGEVGSRVETAKCWPSSRHDTRGIRSSSGEEAVLSAAIWAVAAAAAFPAEPWNWVDFEPHPTLIWASARWWRGV